MVLLVGEVYGCIDVISVTYALLQAAQITCRLGKQPQGYSNGEVVGLLLLTGTTAVDKYRTEARDRLAET